jgi:hypothetical protein
MHRLQILSHEICVTPRHLKRLTRVSSRFHRFVRVLLATDGSISVIVHSDVCTPRKRLHASRRG